MDLLTQRRAMMAAGMSIKPIQLVRNGNFSEGEEWLDYWATITPARPSVTDGVLTLAKRLKGTRGAIIESTTARDEQLSTSHLYYIGASLKAETTYMVVSFVTSSHTAGGNDTSVSAATTDTTWVRKDTVTSPRNSTDRLGIRAGDSNTPADAYGNAKNVILIDLTATFGAGNEPDIDTCRRLFPNDYYEYYTGE